MSASTLALKLATRSTTSAGGDTGSDFAPPLLASEGVGFRFVPLGRETPEVGIGRLRLRTGEGGVGRGVGGSALV